MSRFLIFLFAVAAALIAGFFLLRTPDADFAEMREKYAPEPSVFIETGAGQRLHYRDQGCRNCPAMILLHGSNASLHTFEPLVARLGARYRVITYDQPGHGLSGANPRHDYSASGMFEAVDAIAARVGLDSFLLGGNSMGGWVSWRYALEHPESVEALVLIDASGAPKPQDAPEAELYLAARIMGHPAGRWLAKHFIPRVLVERSLIDSVADAGFVTEAMVERYWELARLPQNRQAMAYRAAVSREPAYGVRLGEISAPTLIIWGAQDKVTPTYSAAVFNQMIPDSRVVMVDDAGHLPMEEQPAATAAALDAFYSEVLSFAPPPVSDE